MVHTVTLVIPAHKAALGLLWHPVFYQGRQNATLMIHEGAAVPLLAVFRHIPPLIPSIEVGGDGHIQLERLRLRRID